MSLPNVAYFSMEIAMDQSLSTYSGGLGFLAGSHMLSAGYLQMPMVGVTMLWSYGYYDQRIDHSGNVEVAYIRKYYDFLTDINVQTEVECFGEKVFKTIINVNVKAQIAPTVGKPVIAYASRCPASKQYKELAKEIVKNNG